MKTPYKWTVDDYHQLVETGLLDGKPVELLEGELIEMSSGGVPHSFTNHSVADYLRTMFKDIALIREAHLITLDNSEPEPDIAVVRLPQNIYKQHHPYPQNIYWLIEVANSTLEKDLKDKTTIYARNRIPEYWVIDLSHNKLWVFTQPNPQGYSQTEEFTTGNVFSLSFPDVAIAVENLLLY